MINVHPIIPLYQNNVVSSAELPSSLHRLYVVEVIVRSTPYKHLDVRVLMNSLYT